MQRYKYNKLKHVSANLQKKNQFLQFWLKKKQFKPILPTLTDVGKNLKVQKKLADISSFFKRCYLFLEREEGRKKRETSM